MTRDRPGGNHLGPHAGALPTRRFKRSWRVISPAHISPHHKPMRSPRLHLQVTSAGTRQWDKALIHVFLKDEAQEGDILGIFASIHPCPTDSFRQRLGESIPYSDWNSFGAAAMLASKPFGSNLAALGWPQGLGWSSYCCFFSWGPGRFRAPRPQPRAARSLGFHLQASGFILDLPQTSPERRGLRAASGLDSHCMVSSSREARMLLDSSFLKRANPQSFGPRAEDRVGCSLGFLKSLPDRVS